ncbi:hypothetical protein [Vibrio harveyi]|uniref:hypothetical protein n=1 Tax=Vibrio harveyi TaxID=669 RepID=UPI003BB66E0A|nr:hypothetical protein [Vibrio harveyi]
MAKNRKVKQMMIDVENAKQGMRGYKTVSKLGWHGFDESGLFHCSGSNFLWLYEGCTVTVLGTQLK